MLKRFISFSFSTAILMQEDLGFANLTHETRGLLTAGGSQSSSIIKSYTAFLEARYRRIFCSKDVIKKR